MKNAGWKKELVGQGARLFTLGLEVEQCRSRIRKMVERGVPIQSAEMQEAVEQFTAANNEWTQLEARHLALRGMIAQGRCAQ